MSKKSLYMILCISLFLSIGFFGCSSKKIGTKIKNNDTATISNQMGFEALTKIDKNNITKIFMRDGMTGDSIVINDNTKIDEFIKMLNNVNCSKSVNQEITSGYAYFADFYSGDTKLLRIVLYGDKFIEIGEINYEMDKAISIEELKKTFNSFPIAKWPNEAK